MSEKFYNIMLEMGLSSITAIIPTFLLLLTYAIKQKRPNTI